MQHICNIEPMIEQQQRTLQRKRHVNHASTGYISPRKLILSMNHTRMTKIIQVDYLSLLTESKNLPLKPAKM